MLTMRRWLMLIWMGLLPLAGCDETETVNCTSESCSGHGTCDDSSGEPVCTCDTGYGGDDCSTCAAGYQDNDQDGSCSVDCDGAGLTCSDHGQCRDDAGEALCACDRGYAGVDCSGCAAGYQDNDQDGECAEDCTISGLECGEHGSCSDESGQAECLCDQGYQGPTCADCATGYQDNDGNTTCEPDCQLAALQCGDHGQCDDSGGTAVCVCGPEYSGPDCADCADGYQDEDQNGSCLPGCGLLGWTCSGVGSCDHSDGTAGCICPDGYRDDGQGNCIQANGHTCQEAIPLDLAAGTETESTVGAGNQYTPSEDCAWISTAPEMVYVFGTAERIRVDFHVSGFDTVVYIRSDCEDAQTEIACDDGWPDSDVTAELDPGSYYLFVDGWDTEQGTYTMTFSYVTDPCADDPCPGVQECQASSDWSTYTCVCPEGWLPWEDSCVEDPCYVNPCAAIEHKNRCVAILPDQYECLCNIGYIDDGQGGCIEDPNANEWAFIVFLNADNDLDEAGYEDMAEMGVAGSTPYVHIVALWDRMEDTARKVYVTQGGYDVLEDLGEINMCDWQNMRDFGVWAVNTYPARHYAFIAWDHGDGWYKRRLFRKPFKGFGLDFDPGPGGGPSVIGVANGDYADALQGITQALGDKLDIVGHDECLMGMWEVAVATAPYAHYLVASEDVEPLDGWAYDDFLPQLNQNPSMTPLELGSLICDAYYEESTDDATLSVIDLETIDDLNTAVTALADAMMAHPQLLTEIYNARNASQTFDYAPMHVDLKDFAMNVRDIGGAPQDLVNAASALIDQLDVSIAYNRAQSSMPGAYGMAIYWTYLSLESSYYNGEGAVWSQRTTWDEFLQYATK